MKGRMYCHKHGGKTPIGPAHPSYKHGRYSKSLPARLLPRLEAGLNDPRLLELREEIALIDSRLCELIDRADKGDAGAIWDALVKEERQFRDAQTAHDQGKSTVHLMELLRLVREGGQEIAAWREIHTVLEQRRRFTESERKRMVEQEQMLTLEQAAVLFKALSSAVRQNVTDRDIMGRIQTEFDRLLTSANPSGLKLAG